MSAEEIAVAKGLNLCITISLDIVCLREPAQTVRSNIGERIFTLADGGENKKTVDSQAVLCNHTRSMDVLW
jgi:hypothetical protein